MVVVAVGLKPHSHKLCRRQSNLSTGRLNTTHMEKNFKEYLVNVYVCRCILCIFKSLNKIPATTYV